MNHQIRSQIRPFSRVATYPTGWAGRLTFAKIMDDCTPLAATLIRKHGISYQDFPDALQRGFEADRSEVWAAWATATDMRIDIERIFERLIAKYEAEPEPHRFRYLVALYYVTTQVQLRDAALIAGINHHYLLDNYASVVRKDVQRAFGELYRPGLRWIDRFKRAHQSPALLVLERYQDNPRMTYAIRSLLEEQHPTEARLNCPWPNINRFRQRAKEALMKAYGCSA